MIDLKPHHTVLAKDVFCQNGRLFLLPESWIEPQSDEIKVFEDKRLVATTDAEPIEVNSELIIINNEFFKYVESQSLLSYTIFSSDAYLKDLPVFFHDAWASSVTTESMCLLGWTVNKYTEPALLYGYFPIQPMIDEVDKIIGYRVIDENLVNKWGLINNYENALKIAEKNTEADLYDEIWRPLAIYVHKYTYSVISKY